MSSIQPGQIESQEKILVTYIEGDRFCGQLTKYPTYLLWQIHRSIVASLPENRISDAAVIKPGSYVAANVEDMFVRAIVLEADHPQYILVFLIDIGIKELVHSRGIRPLGSALDNFPPMAMNISLRQSANVVAGEYRTLTDIEPITVDGETHLLGTLLPSENTPQGTSVTVAASTSNGEVRAATQPAQQQSIQPAAPVQTPPTPAVPAPPAPAVAAKPADAKPKVPQAFALGACQVEVIEANGRVATVRRAGSEKSLRALEVKLVSFSLKYRPATSIEVGDCLLALYKGEEHQWSRALVHDIAGDTIQVEYVDYGIYDYIPRTNIRELPRCFCQEPAHVATIDFNTDVYSGQIYNAVITAKLDGSGRLYTGYIAEQILVQQ